MPIKIPDSILHLVHGGRSTSMWCDRDTLTGRATATAAPPPQSRPDAVLMEEEEDGGARWKDGQVRLEVDSGVVAAGMVGVKAEPGTEGQEDAPMDTEHLPDQGQQQQVGEQGPACARVCVCDGGARGRPAAGEDPFTFHHFPDMLFGVSGLLLLFLLSRQPCRDGCVRLCVQVHHYMQVCVCMCVAQAVLETVPPSQSQAPEASQAEGHDPAGPYEGGSVVRVPAPLP